MFNQIKHTLVAVGFLAACALAQAGVIGPPPPGVYNFSGICTDCDAPPQPIGLALQVGTPASATLTIGLGGPPTWSFEYHSNLFDLSSDFVEVANLSPPDAQGNAQSFIGFGVGGDFWLFTSDFDGNWSLDNQTIQQTVNEDVGLAGVWAAANRVPEPATILMVALGLAVSARRRKAN